jgi:hypothetical protein
LVVADKPERSLTEWHTFAEKNLLGRTAVPNILRDWGRERNIFIERVRELGAWNEEMYANLNAKIAELEKAAKIEEVFTASRIKLIATQADQIAKLKPK